MAGGGWTRISSNYNVLDPSRSLSIDDIQTFTYPQIFSTWGGATTLNFSYPSLPAIAVAEIRAVASSARQTVFLLCQALIETPMYSCAADADFHPTHSADWYGLDETLVAEGTVYATYDTDGCCFNCCRNVPQLARSRVTFASKQVPITAVKLRHSGAPGERFEVEVMPAEFL